MNTKNIVIVILAVALVIVVGWTYYTLTVTVPRKAEAACKANINDVVIPQVTAAAQQQCAAAIGQYQQLLAQLKQVPACAPYIPAQ